MGFTNDYPYMDMHQLNLDWIIKKIQELDSSMTEWQALNQITFSGEWDITKQYPAWTIVNTNGGTEGYISIKPVPAGVTINNADYWRGVVNYTATIADLQNRVVALEQEVADLSADDMIFIGDSYGVDASAGGKAWSSYVADVYPDAYYTMVGGTGFASDLYISNNFLTMLQALSITDKDAIRSIFIFGGANDANLINNGTATTDDIKNRIASFSSHVKANYKNATVYVGFIGWYRTINKYQDYEDAIQAYRDGAEVCDNVVYLSGLEGIMRNPDLINISDLIHPTAEASEILGEYILTAVKTKADVLYHKVFDTALDTTGGAATNVIGISVGSTRVCYDNLHVELCVYGMNNSYNDISVRFNSVTMSYGDRLKIGRFSYTPSGYRLPISTHVVCSVVDQSNNIYEVPFDFYIYDGDFYIRYMSFVSRTIINVLLPSPIFMVGQNV